MHMLSCCGCCQLAGVCTSDTTGAAACWLLPRCRPRHCPAAPCPLDTDPAPPDAASTPLLPAPRVQAQANGSFAIAPCNATAFCGHSTPSGSDAEYACQHIALPADASADVVAAAQQALLSLYPASVDVVLEVGVWVGMWVGGTCSLAPEQPPHLGMVCDQYCRCGRRLVPSFPCLAWPPCRAGRSPRCPVQCQ